MSTSNLTTEQEAVIAVLTLKFRQLGLSTQPIREVSVGPIVTVYRFLPQGNTKVSQIESLSQDFAVALGAEDVMIKRMPGESAVGVFVPNKVRQWVRWINHTTLDTTKYHIPLVLGIDYLGRIVVEDLATLPHLLIAGSTGGGKSTLLNSIIGAWILNYSRDDLQLVLCDIKEGVEFTKFRDAPQLRSLIATSIDIAHIRMDELIDEMKRRLQLLAQDASHNITEYNAKRQGSKTRLPYIAFVVDEFADLLSDRRRIEEGPPDLEGKVKLARAGEIATRKLSTLASKARASGIHLILATQRPSARLLEGDIKTNFTARMAFKLPSQTDSRVVLDTGGAEHLLKFGDMLFVNPNRAGLQRIHAPQSSASDIKAAIEFARAQRR